MGILPSVFLGFGVAIGVDSDSDTDPELDEEPCFVYIVKGDFPASFFHV